VRSARQLEAAYGSFIPPAPKGVSSEAKRLFTPRARLMPAADASDHLVLVFARELNELGFVYMVTDSARWRGLRRTAHHP
jgi:hypothetical protein